MIGLQNRPVDNACRERLAEICFRRQGYGNVTAQDWDVGFGPVTLVVADCPCGNRLKLMIPTFHGLDVVDLVGVYKGEAVEHLIADRNTKRVVDQQQKAVDTT